VRVTADEADAMAAGCGEPKCWAEPGGFCRTPSGTKRRPHPSRVQAARGGGLLGGQGRAWLAVHAGARDDGQTVQMPGAVLILPAAEGVAGAG
jgi:hypothetical protein